MTTRSILLVVVAIFSLCVSQNIWATKSRMKALGQDMLRGTPYIDDTRRIFANPAKINMHTDYAVFEWGDNTRDTPNPEGGFFRNMGNFTYGFYLGVERRSVADHIGDKDNQNKINSNISKKFAENSGNEIANKNEFYGAQKVPLTEEANAIDIFLGGDMGTQWGLKLHYASSASKNAQNTNQNGVPVEGNHDSMAISMGIVKRDIEAYLNYTLFDDSKGFRNLEGGERTSFPGKLENDGTMNFGLSYNLYNLVEWTMLDQWTMFLHYDQSSSKYSATGIEEQTYFQKTQIIGAGHTQHISSNARIFTDIAYRMEDSKMNVEKKDSSLSESGLPITIGIEVDTNSWLTIRGSVGQTLMGKTELKHRGKNYEFSRKSTDVAAGVTLNFGKLKVDSMIGIDETNTNGRMDRKEGNLSLNTLAQVAVQYWF